MPAQLSVGQYDIASVAAQLSAAPASLALRPTRSFHPLTLTRSAEVTHSAHVDVHRGNLVRCVRRAVLV